MTSGGCGRILTPPSHPRLLLSPSVSWPCLRQGGTQQFRALAAESEGAGLVNRRKPTGDGWLRQRAHARRERLLFPAFAACAAAAGAETKRGKYPSRSSASEEHFRPRKSGAG